MWGKSTQAVTKTGSDVWIIFHHIFPLSLLDVLFFKLRTFGQELFGNIRGKILIVQILKK